MGVLPAISGRTAKAASTKTLTASTSYAGSIAAGVCILIAVFALYHGLVFGRLPASNDIVTNDLIDDQYPLRALLADALHHHRFPLWTPYIHAGFPIFAEGQGGYLYPPTLLFALLFPPLATIDAYLILHAILMGCGVFRLTGRITGSTWAAIPSAAAASICGSLVAGHTRTLNAFAVIALTPWLIDCAEQFAGEGGLTATRRRSLARAGLIGGMMALAGHPQFAFIAFCLFGAYVLIRSGLRRIPASTAFVLSTCTIAVAIGWPQLQATEQMATMSERHAAAVSFVDNGSLSWSGMLTFLYPYYAGDAGAASFHGKDLFMFWEGFHYCGALTALLAIAGAVWGWRRHPAVRTLSSIAVACYLLSVGSHFPLYALLRHVPVAGSFRFPARWMLGTEIAVLTLAGFGVSALLERMGKQDRLISRWSILIALAVVVEVNAVAGRQMTTIDPTTLLAGARSSAAHIPAGMRLYVLGDADLLADSYLQSRGWEGNNDAYAYALADLPPNLPAVYHISSVRGYSALGSTYVSAVWGGPSHFGVISQCSDLDSNGDLHVDPSMAKLLRMWHVGAVTSRWPLPPPFIASGHEGEVFTYALPATFPRAWVVPIAVTAPVDDEQTASALIDPRFNPAGFALVSGPPPTLPSRSAPGAVSLTDIDDQTLTMRASTSGLVVLSDTWYPRWRATVDGKPAPVLRVNDCMRGVVSPRAGAVIRMWYDDDHLGWWVALSTICTLAALALAVPIRRAASPDTTAAGTISDVP